jgi:hypothetical protein
MQDFQRGKMALEMRYPCFLPRHDILAEASKKKVAMELHRSIFFWMGVQLLAWLSEGL